MTAKEECEGTGSTLFARGVSVHFEGVTALEDVDLELAPGECSFVSMYILSDDESYSKVMPEESDSGFTPVTPAKVALILSMTS